MNFGLQNYGENFWFDVLHSSVRSYRSRRRRRAVVVNHVWICDIDNEDLIYFENLMILFVEIRSIVDCFEQCFEERPIELKQLTTDHKERKEQKLSAFFIQFASSTILIWLNNGIGELFSPDCHQLSEMECS
ncbi:hypothetical protein RCL_jg9348.t1 [Rhizophagus clarus]|uniref:Uncharacterized protein n=1 Tax=Rhizophagus clarus TaxID=94130 RepID=A0A8H3M7N2_9GLOM|nr:hypothetical protein RCL_jg9348.t1 [Rhizophagus clarus]